MISFEEALSRILESISPMPVRLMPTGKILGHALGQPVVARIDLPPFDNSAVDGFGVRLPDVENASEESPSKLHIKGTVRAGETWEARLSTGKALKILTGAYVPSVVDAIVMKEYCDERDGTVRVKTAAVPGENIRRRGAEFLRGQQMMPSSCLASPAVVALIANVGYKEFPVHQKPRVAVVTTGNELTKLGRSLSPGKIYDSNSYGMESAVRFAGVDEVITLHAAEDLHSTRHAFRRALAFADVVISTGGVSVGEFDFVKEALEQLGVETSIWRIAIKPGKPVYFGKFNDKKIGRARYVFGLPGNPVSALVTYHQFVKPALAKLFGLANYAERQILTGRLTKPLRKKAGRLEFVRAAVSVENGTVTLTPTTGQDSHMLGGLAGANALIHFPLEAEELKASDIVRFEHIRWQLG